MAADMINLSEMDDYDVQEALEPFAYEDFDPEEYTNELFEDNHEEVVAEEVEYIKEKKRAVSKELTKNVELNYERFIMASKEIHGLESDIIQLGYLLNDIKSLTNNMNNLKLSVDSEAFNASTNTLSDYSLSEKPKETDVSHLGAQLGDLSLELDVFISARNFMEAVELVEQGQELLHEITEAEGEAKAAANKDLAKLKKDFETRVSQLSSTLTQELHKPGNQKSYSNELVSYLTRLDRTEEAREFFLQSRSDWIKGEIRKLKFQGDISLYTDEISHLVFSAILNTYTDFQSLFTENRTKSAFIQWMIEELNHFSNLFQRQVFTSDRFQVIAECLQIAFTHSKMLESEGMCITFYLQERFKQDMEKSVSMYYSQIKSVLMKSLSAEQWNGREVFVHELKPEFETNKSNHDNNNSNNNDNDNDNGSKNKSNTAKYNDSDSDRGSDSESEYANDKDNAEGDKCVKLTESAKNFYMLAHRLIADLSAIVCPQIYPSVINGMVDLFEHYLSELFKHNSNDHLNDQQSLSLTGNTLYLVDDLLPRITRQFQRQFLRRIPELEQLKKKLTGLDEALCETFCQRRAKLIVEQKLGWTSPHYPSKTLKVDDMMPSRSFQHLFRFLAKLCVSIDTHLSPDFIEPIITRLLEHVADEFMNGELWDRIRAPPMSEKGGKRQEEEHADGDYYLTIEDVNQVVLDIRFFEAAAEPYLTLQGRRTTKNVVDQIIDIYTHSVEMDQDDVLKPDEWFEERIQKALSAEPLASALITLQQIKEGQHDYTQNLDY